MSSSSICDTNHIFIGMCVDCVVKHYTQLFSTYQILRAEEHKDTFELPIDCLTEYIISMAHLYGPIERREGCDSSRALAEYLSRWTLFDTYEYRKIASRLPGIQIFGNLVVASKSDLINHDH
jgi:hypothetical protein